MLSADVIGELSGTEQSKEDCDHVTGHKFHGLNLLRVNRLSSLTASVALVRETREQPASVESRPGRLLLVRNDCQALA